MNAPWIQHGRESWNRENLMFWQPQHFLLFAQAAVSLFVYKHRCIHPTVLTMNRIIWSAIHSWNYMTDMIIHYVVGSPPEAALPLTGYLSKKSFLVRSTNCFLSAHQVHLIVMATATCPPWLSAPHHGNCNMTRLTKCPPSGSPFHSGGSTWE